jgi:hypothetical protein
MLSLPSSRPRRAHGLALALALAASTPACVSSTDAQADSSGAGQGGKGGQVFGDAGAGGEGASGSIEITPDAEAPSTDPRKPYAALCGTGECQPGAALDGCALGSATGNGGGPATSGAPVPSMSCVLRATEAAPEAVCAAPGLRQVSEPCNTVADCDVGLGCVATSGGQQCLAYCCGNAEECAEKTYCAPRPMAEDPSAMIPACVPTSACQLLDDTSCCAGSTCELTCSVVRDDGTTSCVTPGTGKLADPCPCAAGYICSKLTNECKKLCKIGQDASDCEGGGKCQGATANLPADIGICVAATGEKKKQ